MKFESFAYWLQGFVELTGGVPPTEEQWASIVEHLSLVFNKVTSPVKQPAKQILVEDDTPYQEKDLPKADKDWLKEFEELIRKSAEANKTKPFQPWYDPVNPGTPGWPGNPAPLWPSIAPVTVPGTASPSYPGDYYFDPLGYPRVIC